MSEIKETLGKLSQVLEENRQYLEMGLTDVVAKLNSDYGKQWRFRVRVFPGTVTGQELDYEDQEWITQIRDLPHGGAWQPTLGYTYIPHPRWNTEPGHKRLDAFVKETSPDAQAAIEEWERRKPEVDKVANAEVQEIQQLIDFPREVDRFYDAWLATQGAFPDVKGRFEELRRVDARLTWSGPGATAYEWILKDCEKASDAVSAGMAALLNGLMNYLRLAVDVIKVVIEVAAQRANDIAELAKTILNFDPKNWLSYVGNELINQLKTLNESHAKKLRDGVAALTSVAQARFELQAQFTALKTILGKSSVEWPAPRAEVNQKWDSSVSG